MASSTWADIKNRRCLGASDEPTQPSSNDETGGTDILLREYHKAADLIKGGYITLAEQDEGRRILAVLEEDARKEARRSLLTLQAILKRKQDICQAWAKGDNQWADISPSIKKEVTLVEGCINQLDAQQHSCYL